MTNLPLTAFGQQTYIILLSFSHHERERGEQMVQTTLRIPEKLYEQIKEQAKKRGMSVNGFIIAILCEKKVLQV